MAQHRVVLCVGDSHTDGTLGASYVRCLTQQNQQLSFVASAVNGEPSEIMAKRLPTVLKKHPKPAVVTIMVGSNDCMAQQDRGLEMFYKLMFKISRPADQDAFVSNVGTMVNTLQKTCPDAKVVIMTCPPLTEQPQHPAFVRTAQYNAALKSYLGQHHPSVHIADFHSRCAQFLQDNRHRSKQLDLPPVKFSFLSWMWWQPTAVFRHYVLRQSWNSISASRGLLLLTDQVHMNEVAAQLLTEVVQPFLVL